MSNDGWCVAKLGDLVDIRHGYAFKGEFFRDSPPGDVLLTPGNFAIGGGFRANKLKYYKGPMQDAFILAEGDLLVTMTDLSKAGDTLGYPLRVPASKNGVRYLHNQRLGKLVLRPGGYVREDYLYHLLRMPAYRHRVVAGASGTTVKHTSPKRLQAVELQLPGETHQKAIASLLDGLDEKRLVNLRVAGTLAHIAEALLRAEFIDFERQTELIDSELGPIPRRWPVRSLGDISSPHRTPLDAADASGDEPYIGLEAMPRGSTVLDCWHRRDEVGGATLQFDRGDILFGKLRPYFKKVGVALVSGSCSTEIIVLRPADDAYWSVVLAHATSQEFVDHADAVSSGTRMPRAEWKALCKYQIALPPRETALDATRQVRRIYAIVSERVAENLVLEQLYWQMAPRLLSGEVSVSVGVLAHMGALT